MRRAALLLAALLALACRPSACESVPADEPPTQEPAVDGSASALPAATSPAPAESKAKKAEPAATETTTSKQNVFQRGLVSEQVTAADVLKSHRSYYEDVRQRQLVGLVLAYVAPWSAAAYARARTFRAKFTHVAPLWFQLRPREPLSMLSVELAGGDLVDAKWLKQLRGKTGGGPKVVPRVAFAGCDEAFVLRLASDFLAVDRLLESLTTAVRDHRLDGLTFALYGNVTRVPTAALRTALQRLVLRLADALHKERAELVLEVPPDTQVFGPADFAVLRGVADAFVLTAVNASSASAPGPVAPLPWVRSSLAALVGEGGGAGPHAATPQHPVMLQVALHGFDFALPRGPAGSAWATTGAQFARLLERHRTKALEWDAAAAEHSLPYTRSGYQQRRAWHATLAGVQARLRAAGEAGCGVALWELGAALDYFFDLL